MNDKLRGLELENTTLVLEMSPDEIKNYMRVLIKNYNKIDKQNFTEADRNTLEGLYYIIDSMIKYKMWQVENIVPIDFRQYLLDIKNKIKSLLSETIKNDIRYDIIEIIANNVVEKYPEIPLIDLVKAA